ncbi:hypothetical protein GRZ55_08340 [Chelativorans sp. ZYF759]|uniref:hypothetical protein n=1 Tax=Chelativorans sp. ZYF759 TaxID=2692213 RepID=UPI00145DBE46|nr:hypothetical protein [Chelativorans sp. ZYF759]NMG39248.1 hypothetical protein [Chelativorans sp. ZYF759]
MMRNEQDNRPQGAHPAPEKVPASAGEGSLVDALLALPDDAEAARQAADGRLQAELARKMRSLLRRRPPEAA